MMASRRVDADFAQDWHCKFLLHKEKTEVACSLQGKSVTSNCHHSGNQIAGFRLLAPFRSNSDSAAETASVLPGAMPLAKTLPPDEAEGNVDTALGICFGARASEVLGRGELESGQGG
jgi:hypothetical protein